MVAPKPPILPFPGGPWAGPGGAHGRWGVGWSCTASWVRASGLSNLPGNSSWCLAKHREGAGASGKLRSWPLVALPCRVHHSHRRLEVWEGVAGGLAEEAGR